MQNEKKATAKNIPAAEKCISIDSIAFAKEMAASLGSESYAELVKKASETPSFKAVAPVADKAFAAQLSKAVAKLDADLKKLPVQGAEAYVKVLLSSLQACKNVLSGGPNATKFFKGNVAIQKAACEVLLKKYGGKVSKPSFVEGSQADVDAAKAGKKSGKPTQVQIAVKSICLMVTKALEATNKDAFTEYRTIKNLAADDAEKKRDAYVLAFKKLTEVDSGGVLLKKGLNGEKGSTGKGLTLADVCTVVKELFKAACPAEYAIFKKTVCNGSSKNMDAVAYIAAFTKLMEKEYVSGL